MKLKALVVDDEKIARRLLEMLLERSGYTVASAADGDQAIEALDTDIYHLVLTDLQMGKISGLEVVRKAKTRKDTIVFMVTGCYDEQYKREALLLGADGVLFKPFSTSELLRCISLQEQKRRSLRREKPIIKRYGAAVSG